jgi:hypothetical protein
MTARMTAPARFGAFIMGGANAAVSVALHRRILALDGKRRDKAIVRFLIPIVMAGLVPAIHAFAIP